VTTLQQEDELADGELESPAEEVITVEPEAAKPTASASPAPIVRSRRMRRWIRTGAASAFGKGAAAGVGVVGWSWEIKREGSETRQVRVEVVQGNYVVTDLPAEARNAIRSRGATAVDTFLHLDDPPARIVVSTLGLEPHHAA
jgi:hypothetical protein